MSDMNTAVVALLTGRFDVPADDIRPEATMDELDMDSLALAELDLAIKTEFGVQLAEHEAAKTTTVAELAGAVAARLQTAGTP